MTNDRLLRINDLKLYYKTKKGIVKAVNRVSFELGKGETLAVVGESGCGKTSLARALIRLLPRNIAAYEGDVMLNGVNIMTYDEKDFRNRVRWKRISMVFQGALNALNPVIKVGSHIAEVLILHNKVDKKEAWSIAGDYLKLVGISDIFLDRYPFELSGGMKQRIVIAMALVTNPEIVILDEPTSALDVITQANIINLLKEIKEKQKLTYIFITHDIALSSELADRVAVFYAGELVELSTSEEFYREPMHPYASKLMASVPTLRSDKKLEYIPGSPPSLIALPKGCNFAPRCPYRFDKCEKEPPLFDINGRRIRCWLFEK